MMRFCFLVLLIVFNFCSYILSGQNTRKASNTIVDSALQQESYQNHSLKPSALIIPGTLVVYGGLKPFISGISNLDKNIMDQVQKHYSCFHTKAADYIMWSPSASLYLMDALKVKTKHNFREHLIIDAGSILVAGGIGMEGE